MSTSDEESPLVPDTPLVHPYYDDDDEEEEIFDAESLPHSLLRQYAETDKKIEEKRRQQVYNVLVISLISMLGAIAVPLQFTDIDQIWIDKSWTNISDAAFISYAVFLGTFILGSLVSPLGIQFYGSKNIMVLGMASICALVVAHFFPSDMTLIPASAIVGFLLSSHFIALGVALTQYGYQYAGTKLGGATSISTISAIFLVFHGVFHMFFLNAPLWRTLLKLFILQPQTHQEYLQNITKHEKCGAYFCSVFDEIKFRGGYTSLYIASEHNYGIFKIEAFFGSLLTIALAGLLIITVCVYNPHRLDIKMEVTKKWSACIQATKQIWTVDFALLVPLFVFIGAEQSIIYQIVSKVSL